jgi:immune inhibitor A
MKKLLLSLIAASLWTMQGTAQQQLPKVVDKNGNLMDMPTFDSPEVEHIARKRCGTFMESLSNSKNGQTRAVSTTPNYVPHEGTINIPVILVEFKDQKFSVNKPKEAFEQFFNGTTQADLGNGNQHNYGSVSQYFQAMSSNTFNPVFKVYGPVTLDQNETYYGGTNASGNDEKPNQLIDDAIAKLKSSDEAIKDATVFCNGGTTVDCVYIIYAGLGQNIGGASTTVWAKTGSASGNTLVGRNIRWYSMASELSGMKTKDGSIMIAGVGVSCHEFSHALGLPDIYPSVGTSTGYAKNNQNMEYWDLMDGGEYTYNGGYCPTPYTAWEKEQLGWPVDIQTLDENQSVTMPTSTGQGGTAYKIVNPSNCHEYFLLENIQKKGWNTHQYAYGLMVYHVNEPSNGTIYMDTRLNDKEGYPGMAIVPADGLCASADLEANKKTVEINGKKTSYYMEQLRGDLFPGTYSTLASLNVTELSDANAQPNWHWYKSGNSGYEDTNKALKNITLDTSTGTVSFYYVGDVAAGISTIETSKEEKGRIYTLDGRYVGQDFNALPHGIYIIGGKKIVKS